MNQFLDLHLALQRASGKTPDEKLASLIPSGETPSSRIVAFGGVPIRSDSYGHSTWAGHQICMETLKHHIRSGVGTSAVLTYMNPNDKSLEELGDVCVNLNHLWAYHWITLSIILVGYGRGCELAFARDTRFHLSWAVKGSPGIAFVANGPLKAWRRFASRHEDKSFHSDARAAMVGCASILADLGVTT